jgi:hypothetical protein
MGEIIDITANQPHNVAETMCWQCGSRFISVWPAKTLLKELECGKCHEFGYLFKTGQDLDTRAK